MDITKSGIKTRFIQERLRLLNVPEEVINSLIDQIDPNLMALFKKTKYKDKPSLLICNAFHWPQTREGAEYWTNIYNQARAAEKMWKLLQE